MKFFTGVAMCNQCCHGSEVVKGCRLFLSCPDAAGANGEEEGAKSPKSQVTSVRFTEEGAFWRRQERMGPPPLNLPSIFLRISCRWLSPREWCFQVTGSRTTGRSNRVSHLTHRRQALVLVELNASSGS